MNAHSTLSTGKDAASKTTKDLSTSHRSAHDVALWVPADPIIRDAFGLSLTDLATLTSANAPAPDPTTFSTEDGIVVNVNKTIPPLKLPLEYHETREYVSDDQDSRYELTYRFNRVA